MQMMTRLFSALALSLCLLLPPITATAAPPACNAATEGTIVYNVAHKLVQFCNGTQWIGLTAKIGGAGDTLSDLSCASGQIVQWSGSHWTCADDGGGADNLGDHTATQNLDMDGNAISSTASLELTAVAGNAPLGSPGGVDTLSALSCSSGQIIKFNGTAWACAADDAGMSDLPALTSANIWVGNGSNAATAVAMSGDATLSSDGVLNIANDAIIGPEISAGSITNSHLAGSIALSKIAITGAPDGTQFLRDDGSWQAVATSDTLADLSCTSGQVAKWDGTNWACAADDAGITALTGDVTASGSGSVAATIANNAVTPAKTDFVGTLTEGKWCTVSSGKIVCASDAPSGGGGGGGGRDWDLFSKAANLPQAKGDHSTATLNDGRVLICGGIPSTNRCDIYNPATNTFTQVANLPQSKGRHSAATLTDGRVLICGGTSGANRCDTYDPATDSFTQVANLPQSKQNHSATTLTDGRVLICGGNATNRCYTYDAATNSFTQVANLPSSSTSSRGAILPDGRVLICSASAVARCDIYDPAADSFSPTTLPGFRLGGSYGLFSLDPVAGGRVLMCGGGSPGGSGWSAADLTDQCHLYFPEHESFREVASLPRPATSLSSTSLFDGRVLICGGAIAGSSQYINSCSIYTP